MAHPGARRQVVAFLRVACRRRLAWPAAFVADALTSALPVGGSRDRLRRRASATAEEAVSPFQDAAADPPPEERVVGGFDDGFEEI